MIESEWTKILGWLGYRFTAARSTKDFKLCACGCDASVGTTSWCVFESRHIGGRLETVLRWAKGEGLTQQRGGVMLKSFLYLVAFVAIAAPLVRAQTTSII